MPNPLDPLNLSFMMAYEADQLNHEQIIEGFQRLIDSGLVWHLQGSYGRTAVHLIDAGECHTPVKTPRRAGLDLSTDEGREASGMWDFGPDPTPDFDIPGE